MRLTVRGCSLRTMRLAGFALTFVATLADLSLRYSVVFDWVSATCTAPPPMMAQPAAQADNFARAIRTDILLSSVSLSDTQAMKDLAPAHGTEERRDGLAGQRH